MRQGSMLDKYLRDRYSRQTIFPGIGEEGQIKLLNSCAAIIGCGALGTNVATHLVRAGVGKVRIVDRDFIEYHNLQRQVLFNEDDIKAQLPKAIAAERHLSRVNSSIDIQGIVADVNYTNIEEFCHDADVILDGLDNFETRGLINDVAMKHRIPWIYGGAIASNGMTMTIVPGETPCLRCLSRSIPAPEVTLTCETGGVVGTVPALIGSIQATEAIKLLVGEKRINRGVIMIDVWAGTFHTLHHKFREDCPSCHGKYDYLEQKFTVKVTPLCGQTRAVQIVHTQAKKISLGKLAARLKRMGDVNYNEFMLQFRTDGYELIVFPDGRAIVKNTIDESIAIELYRRYIGELEQK
jgi:molybdopterin/thiamine biosynthesis adenylyltransferase